MYSLLALLFSLILCDSVSVTMDKYDNRDNIVTKSKIELTPLFISCQLDDMAIISAPVLNRNDNLYYLHKPNGDVIKLSLKLNSASIKQISQNIIGDPSDFYKRNEQFFDFNEIVLKYINKNIHTVYPKVNYNKLNVNFAYTQDEKVDVLKNLEDAMKPNEFLIGPFTEEDYGNWVLSVYCRDIDDSWIEMFQVITVQIVERVPMARRRVRLKEGETFHLSFAYPIKDLESCELTAPSSTFDRAFSRTRIDLDKCGYVVENVTVDDEGPWNIIGIGRIMYTGNVHLTVWRH